LANGHGSRTIPALAGGLLLLAALGIVAMGILLMMGQDEARTGPRS